MGTRYLAAAAISLCNIHELSKAEKFCKEALEKYKKLEKEIPGIYTSYIAIILNGLGSLFNKSTSSFKGLPGTIPLIIRACLKIFLSDNISFVNPPMLLNVLRDQDYSFLSCY